MSQQAKELLQQIQQKLGLNDTQMRKHIAEQLRATQQREAQQRAGLRG